MCDVSSHVKVRGIVNCMLSGNEEFTTVNGTLFIFFRKDIGHQGAQLLGSRPTSKSATITALRQVFQSTWSHE